MNEDQTLRMTELDHLIGSHRMQLLKAVSYTHLLL